MPKFVPEPTTTTTAASAAAAADATLDTTRPLVKAAELADRHGQVT